MKKYRIMYLMALGIMLFLYIMTNGKEALLLCILFLLLPIVTGTMARLSGKQLQIASGGPVSCQQGYEIEIPLRLRKKRGGWIGRVEIPVQFENTLFGQREEKRLMLFPDYQGETDYLIPLDTDRCGKVKISLKRLYYYDLLGLFRWEKEYFKEVIVLIYPEPVSLQIQPLSRPQSRETGDAFDEKKRGQDTSETFDLRDYQKGDSIRAVHWKLSTKMDQLLIREFSRPANYSIILLFDFFLKSDKNGRKKQMTNETAALVSAVMDGLLKQNMGHQVGYMNGEEYMEMTVDSLESKAKMLETMLSLKVEKKKSDLIQIFLNLELYRSFTKVIYITEQMDEESASSLGNLINLSVIIPGESQEDSFDSSKGYDVITLSETELKKNMIHLYI